MCNYFIMNSHSHSQNHLAMKPLEDYFETRRFDPRNNKNNHTNTNMEYGSYYNSILPGYRQTPIYNLPQQHYLPSFGLNHAYSMPLIPRYIEENNIPTNAYHSNNNSLNNNKIPILIPLDPNNFNNNKHLQSPSLLPMTVIPSHNNNIDNNNNNNNYKLVNTTSNFIDSTVYNTIPRRPTSVGSVANSVGTPTATTTSTSATVLPHFTTLSAPYSDSFRSGAVTPPAPILPSLCTSTPTSATSSRTNSACPSSCSSVTTSPVKLHFNKTKMELSDEMTIRNENGINFPLERELIESINNIKLKKKLNPKDNDFKCNICSKSFQRAAWLKRHILTHTTYRPFKCIWCKSKHKRRDNLFKHMKLKHMDLLMDAIQRYYPLADFKSNDLKVLMNTGQLHREDIKKVLLHIIGQEH